MDRIDQRPAIERAAETLAALCLGGAVAFCIFHMVPLAGAILAATAAVGGVASAIGGYALLRLVDPGRGEAELSFLPTEFEEPGEDELLLDDPIAPLDPESRVVQLFQREQPDPLPEPGELVARIADYLGSNRAPALPAPEPARNDASAALHAALADIRRSLA